MVEIIVTFLIVAGALSLAWMLHRYPITWQIRKENFSQDGNEAARLQWVQEQNERVKKANRQP